VIASPRRGPARRAQLGAPVLPINASGRYLRHRVSADKAFRARRQTLWLRRAALAFLACCLYFAIGRDLFALAKAKSDSAVTGIRHDTHQIATDIERVATAARLASDQTVSPVAFTSAKTAVEQAGSADIESLLAEQPVDHRSRLRAGR